MLSQNITIKYYLLIIILSVFTINSYSNNSNYYSPSLETSYKVGNVRQIGRASILLPIWQRENQLLYFNAIGMMDNKNNQEGNFGFGFRKILNNKDIILGSFIHYDRKSSPNNNIFNQGTLGLELFNEIFEARLNGYVSLSQIKVLNEKTQKGATLRHTPANVFTGDRHEKLIEAPLHGVDIELGAKLGSLPASIYGGYYYFNRYGAKCVQGPSGRLDIKLTNWLTLGGEVKYDEIRKFQYYVGLNLRFSNSKDNLSPYSLRSKMTQMPLRDVDVVTIDKRIIKKDEHKLMLFDDTDQTFWPETGFVEGVHMGFVSDVVMPADYRAPKVFKNSDITGLKVIRDYRGDIISTSHKTRKISGLKGPLLDKIIDSTVSYLSIDSGKGLINIARGNSIIFHNENHGEITGRKGFGIVNKVYDNTLVHANENHGKISGMFAEGIVRELHNNAKATENINRGEVFGRGSTGVVRKMYNNSQATGNINIGKVSGRGSTGVVRKMYNNSQATGNINRGDVSGYGATGATRKVYNNSMAIENKNEGKVSGRGAIGVVKGLYGNAWAKRNKNIGKVSGKRSMFGDNSVGVVGSMKDDSKATGNISEGDVVGKGSVGAIRCMRGNAQATRNRNKGLVSGENAVGVVKTMRDNSQATENKNEGQIYGKRAVGVVQSMRDESQAIRNKNKSEIVGTNAVGAVKELYENAKAIENINAGDVSGVGRVSGFGHSSTVGVIGDMHDNSQAIGNINTGKLWGIRTVGVIRWMMDSSNATRNKNEGAVSGKCATGVIKWMMGTSQAIGNINIGAVSGMTSNFGDDPVGVIGWMSGNSQATANINKGSVSSVCATGVIRVMNDKSRSTGNINTGEVSGGCAAGVVRALYDKSQSIDNVNKGEVSGECATGVVKWMQNKSQAIGNINEGKITGSGAAGAVKFMRNKSQAKENVNTGDVLGGMSYSKKRTYIFSVGVVAGMKGCSQANGNINIGEVAGRNAVGVVRDMSKRSQANGNINIGKVSGFGARGVIEDKKSGLEAIRNENLKPFHLADPKEWLDMGVTLMNKENVHSPWYLTKDQNGDNKLILSRVAKKEMFSVLRKANFLKIAQAEGNAFLPRELLFDILQETEREVCFPKTVLFRIASYATRAPELRAKTKEDFLGEVLDEHQKHGFFESEDNADMEAGSPYAGYGGRGYWKGMEEE